MFALNCHNQHKRFAPHKYNHGCRARICIEKKQIFVKFLFQKRVEGKSIKKNLAALVAVVIIVEAVVVVVAVRR